MRPIYVLHPGRIRMPNGSFEYYTGLQLARLYGVDFEECLVYSPLRKYTDNEEHTFRHLRPRADGKYSLKG